MPKFSQNGLKFCSFSLFFLPLLPLYKYSLLNYSLFFLIVSCSQFSFLTFPIFFLNFFSFFFLFPFLFYICLSSSLLLYVFHFSYLLSLSYLFPFFSQDYNNFFFFLYTVLLSSLFLCIFMSIYTCPTAHYSFYYLFSFPNLSFWLISPSSGYVFILSLTTNIRHNVKFPFLSFSSYCPPFFLTYTYTFNLLLIFPPCAFPPHSLKFQISFPLSFIVFHTDMSIPALFFIPFIHSCHPFFLSLSFHTFNISLLSTLSST